MSRLTRAGGVGVGARWHGVGGSVMSGGDVGGL